MRRALLILMVSFPLTGFCHGRILAQEAILPPGDTSPLLRLETNGPRSYVSGLAFSPDGQHLYSTGWDKAVQVWNLRDGRFEYSAGATLRVPTGAGPFGELNALALSANGKWLATAGQGQPREVPGERTIGWVLPAGNMSQVSQLDNGMIYVFNTNTRTTTLLRGHRGPVQALAFVQNSQSDPPELVSVAEEHTDGSSDLISRVRFWDISKGSQAKEIASLSAVPDLEGKKWVPLPSLNGFRPGLNSWSTGGKPNQARVALAWGDDQFRIWDVQTGQVAITKSNPNLLAVLKTNAAGQQFITGAHAEIGLWTIPNGAKGQLTAINRQHFQAAQIDSVNGKSQNLPNAATLIPGKNGKSPQVAIVVTHYLPNGKGEYRLVLATADSTVKSIREIELPWRGEIRQPAIAASSDGRQIALAGNERNEIEIYQVDDLIQGRNTPKQVLGSVGLAFKDAIFVRSQDRWGLQLSESRRDTAGRFPADSLVFDIHERRIELSSDKWKPAIATMLGWSAQMTAPQTISVTRPDMPTLELKLLEEHVASGYAFCPVSPPHCPIPLIAVASQVRGQPLVQIFNGETGDQLRWCVGHTERVRSLSFSDDGRMLITVGDDRTICGWTMTDLVERTLNQHGQISRLIVHSREKGIVVTSIPEGSALQPGDEIVAAVRRGEVVELETAKDFYRFAWDRVPGSVIELTIRRGNESKTVKCDVGQAIDEAKPLFTLFVTPGDRKGEWEWIGWNPMGNFDVRGDRVDRWLGWHFNTDDPQHPAKFAPIGEYREAFYRRDLLETLIELQKLPPALVVVEDPKVSVWLRNHDGTPIQTDYENITQLDAVLVDFVADLSGITDRQVESLTVSIDDAPAMRLKHSSTERQWTTDLSNVQWQRGIHRVTTRLKAANREVVANVWINFHPARPSVKCEFDPLWKRGISTSEITVNATVTAASEPLKIELLLERPGSDEPVVIRHWDVSEEVKIDEKLTVEPGDNRLEIVAWNATVPNNEKNAETTRVSTVIRRSTPPMAPRIVVDDVSIVPEKGDPQPLLADGDAYHALLPQVRIRGQITATSRITSARMSVGDDQHDLAESQSGEIRQLKFDKTLMLTPGRRTVVIHSSVGSEQDEKRLVLVYEPPAPVITSLAANVRSLRALPKSAKRESSVYFEKYDEQVATLTSVLEGQLDHPYRVVLRVNDVLVANDMLQIDRSQNGQHIMTASVPLIGGQNSVSMRVDNEWTQHPNSRNLEFEFRRPPEIVEISAEKKIVERPFDLSCRLRSAIPIRLTKVTVDNTDEIRGTLRDIEGSPGEYLLQVEKVGLSEGAHVLRITATNDEGSTLEPAIHNVVVEKPVAKPPVLSISGPTASDVAIASNTKRLEIQYQVRSSEPSTILIKNSGSKVIDQTIDSTDVLTNGSNNTLFLDLMEGTNDIELTAQSSGGFSEKQRLKVSYVPTAAIVEIVSVDDQRPQLHNDGTGFFERSASKSRVKVRGQVKTKDRFEAGKVLKARIWVNNFKLPTVDVTTDREDAATFSTEVTLSRSKRNEIKVEIYGEEGHMASELGCTNALSIDCDNPERRQDLYLVLLGTGGEVSLRESALSALRAKVKTKGEAAQEMWESEAFSQIHVFDALNVHPVAAHSRLLSLVRTMNGNLKSISKSGPQSIVMVYFQGQISLTQDDFSFVTSKTQQATDKAVTGKLLETDLKNTYGAHLIFLDLTQNTKNLTASDIWPKAPNLGIAVSNWKGQGQQPAETRLITALEQSLPQIRIVRDLAAKIDQRYQLAQKKFPEQVEAVDRLQGLQDVRIGILE